MANEKEAKKETGSGVVPFIIIGGIFLATILGIWWISQSGGSNADTNTNTTTGNNGQPKDTRLPNYDSAPAGATPAHFKGDANSPVLVEEFADFQCPTCGVVHPKMNELSAKYGNRVKFIYRNYPLTSIHPNAYGAAVASEAAALQGKFWQMQDILFRNQTQWSNLPNPGEQFAEYAKTIGLDVEKFNNDILSMNTKQRVDFDMQRGKALNINSTPTILINGRPVAFQQLEVEAMSSLIDAELAKFQPAENKQTDSASNSSDKKQEASNSNTAEKSNTEESK